MSSTNASCRAVRARRHEHESACERVRLNSKRKVSGREDVAEAAKTKAPALSRARRVREESRLVATQRWRGTFRQLWRRIWQAERLAQQGNIRQHIRGK